MEPNYVYRDGNGQPTDEPSLRAAYAEEFKAEESPVQPIVVSVPKPEKLTNEDRLLAENLALKVQNLTLLKQSLVNEANAKIAKLDQQLVAAQAEIKTVQTVLSNKYDIDFTKQEIEAGTGRIIPAS